MAKPDFFCLADNYESESSASDDSAGTSEEENSGSDRSATGEKEYRVDHPEDWEDSEEEQSPLKRSAARLPFLIEPTCSGQKLWASKSDSKMALSVF